MTTASAPPSPDSSPPPRGAFLKVTLHICYKERVWSRISFLFDLRRRLRADRNGTAIVVPSPPLPSPTFVNVICNCCHPSGGRLWLCIFTTPLPVPNDTGKGEHFDSLELRFNIFGPR